ncbi:CynX/NimT family MFS transporter [Cytobacillus purgationiresistens]|uniref:CP family cyanate transporter-like MFS transporter n=1 Tax=Cytobacillus purgationiresistens TaxID=863449 RepID=A0ABU0AMJ7_9BACI|nr:MFS transporter [Cytobacillus purgationiresistens]MDQ0272476.1 CP family cyanate transporter-like MFS transporter [Cytobacillus purgationiresistens]
MNPTQDKMKNSLFILGIIVVAFNLRPAITSIGPLISSIKEDIGLSNGTAGLLTTLPLIAFAIISPFAPKIANKLGSEMAVLIGLMILGSGIMLRSSGILIFLFSGTIFIGLGIAICNVLLPSIVKEKYPLKVGLMTGVYTLSMGICAGLAPGLSISLVNIALDWQSALSMWAVLTLLAIFLWLPHVKRKSRTQKKATIQTSISSLWGSPLAWQITLFMGLQSLIFFSFCAWLPEILTSRGLKLETAGWMLTLMQYAGLPTSFIIPIIATRLSHQKGIALGIGTLMIAGLTGVFFSSSLSFIIISIILVGLALGAAISHSLTLISLRAINAKQAADLSGMAQSFGYLLAAAGPFLIGLLYDLFHSWTIPLALLIVAAIIFTFAGIGAGRDQFVSEENNEASTTSA